MKNLTVTEEDLLIVIMDCLFFKTGISSNRGYPGVTLTAIEDDHICHLTISIDSRQFFKMLSNKLEYDAIMNYYKEVENLGYTECISSLPESPDTLSIFLSQYCDNLRWYSEESVIGVDVSKLYIDFKSIEKLILKLKKCSAYGFTLDKEKLIDKLYTDIRNGVYDLDEDEYI